MLRNRDVLAVFLSLLLTRMAWNDEAENLSANIHLAFYFPVATHQIGPAPLDTDGDGSTEALVTIRPSGGSGDGSSSEDKQGTTTKTTPKSWTIHVLDLKPLHSGEAAYGKTAFPRLPGAPFQPRELIKYSEPITFEEEDIPPDPELEALEKEEAGGVFRPNRVKPSVFIRPLQIITGQVMVEGVKKPKDDVNNRDLESEYQNSRTRHYFCGKDWHDAATKCGTPCPSGTTDECPDDERCYADTPCDSTKDDNVARTLSNEWSEGSHYVTPAGGLPSVFVAWSNGQVSMHSLTAAKDTDGDSKMKKFPRLELKAMWTTKALPTIPMAIKNPQKVQLTFLDSYDSMEDAPHGMVIISGELPPRPEDMINMRKQKQPKIARFIVALDAMNGEILWDSLHNFEVKQEQVPLPVHIERGTSSIARRRSMVAQLDASMTTTTTGKADDPNEPTSEAALPNCLTAYRSSLLGTTEALPYAYWGLADAGVRAVHLDHTQSHRKLQKHHPNQPDFHKHHASSTSSSHVHKPGALTSSSSHHHHHKSKKGKKKPTSGQTSKDSWHSALINPRKRKKNLGREGGHIHYGRPNVLVNHHQGGLHVHSLQNGQPLCQMSLLEDTLYVDLQQDGVLDSIQVITQSKNLLKDMETGEFRDPWVADLARRIEEQNPSAQDEAMKDKNSKVARQMKQKRLSNKLCHALALSGMPAQEELFSTSLCYTGSEARKNNDLANNPNLQVFAAPPLVVESLYAQHRNRERDIIFAMSNGVVSRIRGSTGRRQWKLNGKRLVEGFPSWGRWEAQQTVSLTRLEVLHPQSGGGGLSIKPHARPILLVGESSLAVLSATNANVLAVANVPQRSFQRPILADISGDGTTDVMVVTSDAVWGYVIQVQSGASIFFRILVGCLMMGILLAVLRNRFGHHQMRNQHKRSTDA